jgi:hypothetical protein
MLDSTITIVFVESMATPVGKYKSKSVIVVTTPSGVTLRRRPDDAPLFPSVTKRTPVESIVKPNGTPKEAEVPVPSMDS